MKKFLPWIIGLVVVLIIVLAVGKKQGWLGKEEGIKVSAELATSRDIIETVSANGKIEPEVEVKVSPDISGELVELFVKEGAEVQQGELMARINPDIYKSSYDRAVAALNTQRANEASAGALVAQSRARFANARLSYQRNESLYKQGAVSASEFDAAKATFEVAEAELQAAEQNLKAAQFTVKSAEASVKEAGENLFKTSIYAPTKGTVSRLSVEKGERVVGASQFSSGTEIMRIANLNTMSVKVSVNENDIVRVKMGDTAIVEVDAYLDKKFKGIVTEIATSANITGVSIDQVTNFDVKIRILAESYAEMIPEDRPGFSPFRPGMSATVDIQTESMFSVLSVPIQAVTTRSDTVETEGTRKGRKKETEDELEQTAGSTDEQPGQEVVFVFEDGKARLVKVQTGIQDNMYIQITSGLEEGQEVITAPYRAVSRRLKDGDKVVKVPREELFGK